MEVIFDAYEISYFQQNRSNISNSTSAGYTDSLKTTETTKHTNTKSGQTEKEYKKKKITTTYWP